MRMFHLFALSDPKNTYVNLCIVFWKSVFKMLIMRKTRGIRIQTGFLEINLISCVLSNQLGYHCKFNAHIRRTINRHDYH